MTRKLKINLAIFSSMSIIIASMVYIVFLESTGYNQSILFQLIGSVVLIITSFAVCYLINKYKALLRDVYGDDRCLYIYEFIFLTSCFLFFYMMSRVMMTGDTLSKSLYNYLLNVFVVIPPMCYSYKYTKGNHKFKLNTKVNFMIDIVYIMLVTVTLSLTNIWIQVVVKSHNIPVWVAEVVTTVNSVVLKGLLVVSIVCCVLVFRDRYKDLRKHNKGIGIFILDVILTILAVAFLLLSIYEFYIYYL